MSKISIGEARQIGARNAALGFLCMFILTEAMAFFVNTREDFSNGVGVFLRGQADRYFLGAIIVMFCAVLLLGRAAGKQILVDGRHHIVIAMINAGYTLLVTAAYLWGYAHFSHVYVEDWTSFIVIIALICGCVWLIAVLGIRRALK